MTTCIFTGKHYLGALVPRKNEKPNKPNLGSMIYVNLLHHLHLNHLEFPTCCQVFSSSRLLMRISSVTCGVSTSTPLMFPCTKSLAKGPCRCAPKLCAAGIGQWASKRKSEHGKDKDAIHTHLSYQHICEPSQLSVSGVKTMC